jgi:endonuclease/exonuclease/phosphatase family metal-dependent hydrolase
VKAAALILLTLNVAGPRRVHQGWPSRRAAIVERLAAEKPDAAAFQEIWRRDDADALAAGAGHAPGAFDERSGLALSSRHPLSERAALDLGEGYGALCARAAAPAGAFTLCSVRLEPGLGAAKARRVGQLVEAAEFVRARASSSPFVVLGDLGASADDPETRLFLDLLGGRDLCVRHGDEVCGRTREDSRVDFAVVPYSSKEPGGASTAFTELSGPPEDPVPLPPRFGLKAELLPAAAKLRAAARRPRRGPGDRHPHPRGRPRSRPAATRRRFLGPLARRPRRRRLRPRARPPRALGRAGEVRADKGSGTQLDSAWHSAWPLRKVPG